MTHSQCPTFSVDSTKQQQARDLQGVSASESAELWLDVQASSAWCGCLKAFGLTLCSADFGMPYLCQQSGVGMELLIPDVYVVLGVIMSMLGVVLTRLRHQKAKGPLSYITQQVEYFC